MSAQLTIVIPCFNEGDRLNDAAVLSLLEPPDVQLILADDGSTDNTLERLGSLQRQLPDRVHVLPAKQNRGKAETVRSSMLRALDLGADAVGYLDADMSAPPGELLRLWATMCQRDLDMVIGSRIALLGTRVERHAYRHYLGRLFATAAAHILDLCVYDTQCGAKIVRRCEALRAALSEPFISRWAFDVELIGRLLTGNASAPPLAADRICEVPLDVWTDVPGSKLRLVGMARTAVELARVGADISRRRQIQRDANRLPRRTGHP